MSGSARKKAPKAKPAEVRAKGQKRWFTPAELTRLAEEDPAALLAAALQQIAQLQQRSRQLEAARAEVRAKAQRIKELEALLAEAQRASFRQAAPFRVEPDKRTTQPKRPGRRPGHPGACRPRPQEIDEHIEVELGSCARCGGHQWAEPRAIEQFIEEIPKMKPQVTRLVTYAATCACCGHEAASRHPLQVSTATGAAGVHLGPRALALATDLNKAKGLPMRKTCAVLKDHFGLELTPGGLCQALDRVARRAQPHYEHLREELRCSPVVHVDETSWWVGGVFHWLWVVTNPDATFYWVDQRRNRAVIEALLDGFGGVLVSDCLSTYDLETGVQQKCYAHHLKAIAQAKKIHAQQGEGFLANIGQCLQEALDLGQQRPQLPPEEFGQHLEQLERRADTLLEPPQATPAEEAVRQRLRKQRDHLFTFLIYPGVDATNNLAERQLRPAVIARKISCGNKTQSGVMTFQILRSLAATAAQRHQCFIDFIAHLVSFDNSA